MYLFSLRFDDTFELYSRKRHYCLFLQVICIYVFQASELCCGYLGMTTTRCNRRALCMLILDTYSFTSDKYEVIYP